MGGFQNDPGTVQQEAGFGFDGNFWTESNGATLTAKAGGGQGGATLLPWMVNNVGTVASIGDSVILPPSKPGAILQVSNQGANSMNVFAQGSDTINGNAAAVGVAQMASSTVTYSCLKPGVWTAQGIGGGAAGQFPTFSVQAGITAHAGGGQGSAVPLTAATCFIATVATAGDSVVLPPAQPGMEITVVNQSATATGPNVFPSSGQTINAGTANTAVPVPPQCVLIFYCGVAGAWWTK